MANVKCYVLQSGMQIVGEELNSGCIAYPAILTLASFDQEGYSMSLNALPGYDYSVPSGLYSIDAAFCYTADENLASLHEQFVKNTKESYD